jgi:hypothetical protein
MVTSAGFAAGLLEDLEVNPLEEQEAGRASFRASMLANYIRETLKYYHF